MFFVLFVEIQFADGFIERWVEGESVFEVADEVFDELLGILDLVFEKIL